MAKASDCNEHVLRGGWSHLPAACKRLLQGSIPALRRQSFRKGASEAKCTHDSARNPPTNKAPRGRSGVAGSLSVRLETTRKWPGDAEAGARHVLPATVALRNTLLTYYLTQRVQGVICHDHEPARPWSMAAIRATSDGCVWAGSLACKPHFVLQGTGRRRRK